MDRAEVRTLGLGVIMLLVSEASPSWAEGEQWFTHIEERGRISFCWQSKRRRITDARLRLLHTQLNPLALLPFISLLLAPSAIRSLLMSCRDDNSGGHSSTSASGKDKASDKQKEKARVSRTSLILWHAHQNDAAAVRKLLEEDQSLVHARDYDSRTPLHVASLHGWIDVAKCLIEFGADVNAQDRWKNTVFFFLLSSLYLFLFGLSKRAFYFIRLRWKGKTCKRKINTFQPNETRSQSNQNDSVEIQ